MQMKTVTAAILVIGDEILSGRTKDKNIGYIAEYMTALGIDVKEVRVVPDEEPEIIAGLNVLRMRYTYVFTTGGIGPTHDDITADSVAKAFGVEIAENEQAVAMLLQRFKREELTEARRRMARIPVGATLIENPVSNAPGFNIGNVFVMAGVPAIMQAMLDNLAPGLETGTIMLSETIHVPGIKEGDYGDGLAIVAAKHPLASIGSYPRMNENGFANQIVVRARDETILNSAVKAVHGLIQELQAQGF